MHFLDGSQREEFDHLCKIRENELWKTQRGDTNADYLLMEDVDFKSFYNENVIGKPFQITKESKEDHKAPTNKEIKSIRV